MEDEFEVPTWRQLYSMLLSQTKKIRKSNFKPDITIALSRGGWIPARVLADLLETSLGSVSIEFYIGISETRKAPILKQGSSVDVAGKKVLLVDDVVDSGESLKLAKSHLEHAGATEVRTVTLFTKPWSSVKPDYYSAETTRWVVFPWETKETIRSIVRKNPISSNMEIAKLVKAGLSKRLAERFLKEIAEERSC
ncbi:MAG: phosphoribosyltransferase [Candidatus Bathyarchaeia archaeon]